MSLNLVRNKLMIRTVLSNSKKAHVYRNTITRSSSGLQRFCYNISRFHQYGLMRDDVLDEDIPEVTEAVRRLPEDVKLARDYRLLRAMQLMVCREVLPQSEWMKYENDERYLAPYLEEVYKEREEQEEWNKLY